MTNLFLVAFGGAIGAVLRYLAGVASIKWIGKSDILTGTVFANIIGCFFAGIALGWITGNPDASTEKILFLTTGLLGSLTTFSTFALETRILVRKSTVKQFFVYLFFQVVVAFSVAAAGYGLYNLFGGIF